MAVTTETTGTTEMTISRTMYSREQKKVSIVCKIAVRYHFKSFHINAILFLIVLNVLGSSWSTVKSFKILIIGNKLIGWVKRTMH